MLKNGSITYVQCEQVHDSMLLDAVACYISYDNLTSGIVWEFYYFLEDEKWVGTNLGIISVVPSDHCVANIEFKNKLGQGINDKKVPCDRP